MNTLQKKRLILYIAEELFCCYGLKNTTVRLITENAGINTAMLNYYFVSKEDLFLLIIRSRIEKLMKAKRKLKLKNKSVLEKIVAYANFYIDLIVDYLPFYRLMLKEKLLNENDRVVKLIDFYLSSNMQRFKEILSKGIAEKKSGSVNIETFTVTLWGLMLNIIFKIDGMSTISNEKEIMKFKEQVKEVILIFFIENNLS